jgi:regulator of sigma E protease
MLFAIIVFIIVLSVLVFIHEFGHFSAAKLVGVRVERFSLGLPPKAITLFKRGHTEYVISWIPFGGYVKLAGENPDEEEITGADYELMSKPKWARFIIFFAGVFMNFMLAVAIFFLIFWVHGTEYFPITPIKSVSPNSVAEKIGFQSGDKIISVNGEDVNAWNTVYEEIFASVGEELDVSVKRGGDVVHLDYKVTEADSLGSKGIGFQYVIGTKVGGVQQNSPADNIGLTRGDVIKAINGKPVSDWKEMTDIIYGKAGESVTLEWVRNGKRMKSEVTPKEKLTADEENFGQTKKVGMIGVSVYNETRRKGFFEAIVDGFVASVNVLKFIVIILGGLLGGKIPANSIGGPIAAYQMTRESMQWGMSSLLSYAAIFSVNLAVLNILPLPALDGGHILLLLIEGIKGKPISQKARLVWQQIGVALILLLMIFALSNDVLRVFDGFLK